jgi:hypothetical protein
MECSLRACGTSGGVEENPASATAGLRGQSRRLCHAVPEQPGPDAGHGRRHTPGKEDKRRWARGPEQRHLVPIIILCPAHVTEGRLALHAGLSAEHS